MTVIILVKNTTNEVIPAAFYQNLYFLLKKKQHLDVTLYVNSVNHFHTRFLWPFAEYFYFNLCIIGGYSYTQFHQYGIWFDNICIVNDLNCKVPFTVSVLMHLHSAPSRLGSRFWDSAFLQMIKMVLLEEQMLLLWGT